MTSTPDGPPYFEHPLDAAVRNRAREQARVVLRLARDEPGGDVEWNLSDEHLDEVLDLAVASAFGTFAVAFAVWEEDLKAAAASTTVTPDVATDASAARRAPTSPAPAPAARKRTTRKAASTRRPHAA